MLDNAVNKSTKDSIDQNIIVQKLKKLKFHKNYTDELLSYYQILSPEKCKEFNINKNKTEKELFYEIVVKFIEKFKDVELIDQDNDNEENEVQKYAKSILESPATDELKYLKLKEVPSRWNYVYKKVIIFEKEKNEELIYYNLSNNFLVNMWINPNSINLLKVLHKFNEIFELDNNKKNIIDDLPPKNKKFILLGLCHSEFVGSKFKQNNIFNIMKSIKNKNIIEEEFNNQKAFGGILNEIIIKYSCSKLARDSFENIFEIDLPKEIEEELFTKKILNYLYYIPFNGFANTERTDRRFSLILINQHKNCVTLLTQCDDLDELLFDFINIVIRKFIFQHEHNHLSGGLLYFIGKLERINTPKQKYENGKLTKLSNEYELTSEEKKKLSKNEIYIGKERGELFEKMYYGKVLYDLTLIELLFIADERNDELTREEHLIRFQEFTKYKKLENALEEFPNNQTLSKLVKNIYDCLMKKKKKGIKVNLSEKSTVARKYEDSYNFDDIIKKYNSEKVAKVGKCYLSYTKPDYKDVKSYDIED